MMALKRLTLHKGDLPDSYSCNSGTVAIDTETMGLNLQRDRLCLVQLSSGGGFVDLIQIEAKQKKAPNLTKLLKDSKILKLFHYARFDMAALYCSFGVMPQSVFCTKIASKLARTYTDHHGLKDLCAELLNVSLSKQQQCSYWGAEDLSKEQQHYAAGDVLYLHQLKDILEQRLQVVGRLELAQQCFKFLPLRVRLDLAGFENQDIFAHN